MINDTFKRETMRKSKIKELDVLCYAVVLGGFADMHNPLMRGENFSWGSFPDMMTNRCVEQAFMMGLLETEIEFAKKHAREMGLALAKATIDRMTDGVQSS